MSRSGLKSIPCLGGTLQVQGRATKTGQSQWSNFHAPALIKRLTRPLWPWRGHGGGHKAAGIAGKPPTGCLHSRTMEYIGSQELLGYATPRDYVEEIVGNQMSSHLVKHPGAPVMLLDDAGRWGWKSPPHDLAPSGGINTWPWVLQAFLCDPEP